MANIFPEQFRDKLFGSRQGNNDSEMQSISGGTIHDELDGPDIFGKAPLAEFYPAASVIFADIVGFTVSSHPLLFRCLSMTWCTKFCP